MLHISQTISHQCGHFPFRGHYHRYSYRHQSRSHVERSVSSLSLNVCCSNYHQTRESDQRNVNASCEEYNVRNTFRNQQFCREPRSQVLSQRRADRTKGLRVPQGPNVNDGYEQYGPSPRSSVQFRGQTAHHSTDRYGNNNCQTVSR